MNPSSPQAAAVYLPFYADVATDLDKLNSYDMAHMDIVNSMTSRSTRFYEDSQEFQPMDPVRYPPYIVSKINGAEVLKKFGIIPEIKRAWISCDNILMLWDYSESRQRICEFDKISHVITAVEFVAPPKGVFTGDVIGILAVGTTSDIHIVAIRSIDDGTSFVMLPTGLQCGLPSPAESIKSTPSGRIFVSCANGSLAEVCYIGSCGLASTKKGCTWKKAKQPIVETILSVLPLPASLGGTIVNTDISTTDQSTFSLSLDNDRDLCYHLRNRGKIIEVDRAQKVGLDRVTTYKTLSRDTQAHIHSGANKKSSGSPQINLVGISPIGPNVSNAISLIGFSEDGTRFMFTLDGKVANARFDGTRKNKILGDSPLETSMYLNDGKSRLRLLFPVQLNLPDLTGTKTGRSQHVNITFARQFVDVSMLGTSTGDVIVIMNDMGGLTLKNDPDTKYSSILSGGAVVNNSEEKCVRLRFEGAVHGVYETSPAGAIYSNAIANKNIYYNSWFDSSSSLVNRRFDVITDKGVFPVVRLCPANVILRGLSMGDSLECSADEGTEGNRVITSLTKRIGSVEALSAAIFLVVNKLSNSYNSADSAYTGSDNSTSSLVHTVYSMLLSAVNGQPAGDVAGTSVLYKALLLTCFRMLKPFWNKTFGEMFGITLQGDTKSIQGPGVGNANVAKLQQLHVHVTNIVSLMRFIHNIPPIALSGNAGTSFVSNLAIGGVNRLASSVNFRSSASHIDSNNSVQASIHQIMYLLDYARQVLIFTRCEGGNRTLGTTLRSCLTMNKFRGLTFSRQSQELAALCPDIARNTEASGAIAEVEEEERIRLVRSLKEINDISGAGVGLSGAGDVEVLCSKEVLGKVVDDLVAAGIRSIADMTRYESHLKANLAPGGRGTIPNPSTMLPRATYVDLLVTLYIKSGRRDEAATCLLREATRPLGSDETNNDIPTFDSRLELLVRAIAVLTTGGRSTRGIGGRDAALLAEVTDTFDVALVQHEMLGRLRLVTAESAAFGGMDRESRGSIISFLTSQVRCASDLLRVAGRLSFVEQQIELILLSGETSTSIDGDQVQRGSGLAGCWRDLILASASAGICNVGPAVALLARVCGRPNRIHNFNSSASLAVDGMLVRSATKTLLAGAMSVGPKVAKEIVISVVGLAAGGAAHSGTAAAVAAAAAGATVDDREYSAQCNLVGVSLPVEVIPIVLDFCKANAHTSSHGAQRRPGDVSWGPVLLEALIIVHEAALSAVAPVELKVMISACGASFLFRSCLETIGDGECSMTLLARAADVAGALGATLE